MTDATLRLATEADAAALRRIYVPYVEETPITFECSPPSTATMRERVRQTLVDYPWLVCEVDGDVVGYASAGPLRDYGAFQWTAESSVYVARDARGAGYGSALYASLLAALEHQGYVTVTAAVTLPNPASVALHESFGFEREGTSEAVGHKNGSWHDVGWWSLRLRDPPADPEPPLSLPAARERDGWEEALDAGRTVLGD